MTLKQGVKIHTVAITCYNFAYVAVRMLKAIRFYYSVVYIKQIYFHNKACRTMIKCQIRKLYIISVVSKCILAKTGFHEFCGIECLVAAVWCAVICCLPKIFSSVPVMSFHNVHITNLLLTKNHSVKHTSRRNA